ncbi:unnamed protein product, partial [Prorocentrum cordatum]
PPPPPLSPPPPSSSSSSSSSFLFLLPSVPSPSSSSPSSSALCAAGVASLSEPFWFEQLNCVQAGPRDPEDEAEVQTAFACQVVAWTVTLRLFPSATLLALNPKGFGFLAHDLYRRAFPLDRFDARFVMMYRDARDVVESFGSIFFKPAAEGDGKGSDKGKGKPKGKGKGKGKARASRALRAKCQ